MVSPGALIRKNNNCTHVQHTFMQHLFADYDEKMPNFTFYGGRKQATTKYYFLFLNLDAVVRNSASGEFTYIWQSKWVKIFAKNI